MRLITTTVIFSRAILAIAVGFILPAGAMASDFLDGNTADTWIIDYATGRTVSTFKVGKGLRTVDSRALSATDVEVELDDAALVQVGGLDLLNQSVVINKLENSYPVPGAAVGIPYVTLTGLTTARASVTDETLPGITISPAGGSFSRTVEVKLHAIAGRGNNGVMVLKWKINGGATLSVTPADDAESGYQHSLYFFENGTYDLETWAEQGGVASPHEIVQITISGTDYQRDSDGDGIPDAWEIANGLDPLTSNRNLDSDGDGLSDFDEIIRGSDPYDAASLPTDTDGDGWFDFDEDLRETNKNDLVQIVELNLADKPAANRLHEIEYLLNGSIYSDPEELVLKNNMAALTVYDIQSSLLYDSAALASDTELVAALASKGIASSYLSSLPARLRGSLASTSLVNSQYPDMRVAAGQPLIVRSPNAVFPQWVTKTWIDGKADISPSEVTDYLASVNDTWDTPELWQAAYVQYLDDNLSQVLTEDMSPVTGLGVTLVEAVVAWHSRLTDGAFILLGNESLLPTAAAVESLQSHLNQSGSDWQQLLVALKTLVVPGGYLNDLRLQILNYYADLASIPVNAGNPEDLITTTRASAMELQSASANPLYRYAARLVSIGGLTAVSPGELNSLMDIAGDFDADGLSNGDELMAKFGRHTSPFDNDSDADFIPDSADICPTDASNQCLTIIDQNKDTDGDGIIDSLDNCMRVANADQTDTNADNIGDACRRYANIAIPSSDVTIWLGQSVAFSSIVTELGGSKSLTYQWDFAGGAVNSTQADPGEVSFTVAGVYDVSLIVTDQSTGLDLGTDVRRVTVLGSGPAINILLPPAQNEGVLIALNSSTSSYGQTGNVRWTFGDGGSSQGSLVLHNYVQNGSYTVTAEVTDAYGNIAQASAVVTVNDTLPIPAFTTDVTQGSAPLLVTFTDQSSAYDGISTYIWNFDDGSSSTQQSPSHSYSSEGIYNVTLTVIDTDGSVVTSAAQQITVSNALPDGDVNGDGVVDAVDMLLVTRHLRGQVVLSGDQLIRADVAPQSDGIPVPDGQITAADLMLIQRKSLGLADF